MNTPSTPPPLSLFLVGLLGSALVAAAAPGVLLDETFADGDRTTQAPPASVEWLSAGPGSTVDVAPGSLTQEGGGRHLLAYFAADNAPVELAPGEGLLLTYEIAVNGPMDGSGALRVGLFDSGGARVLMDKQSRSDDFNDYRGYMGASNPAPSKNRPLRVLKRTHHSDSLVSALTAFSSLGDTGGAVQSMSDGVACKGTLLIERTSPGLVSVTHGFSGGGLNEHSVSAVDGADVVTRYDTVVFHAGTKAAQGFTLKSVRIEIVPVAAR